jgi:hypothetical protein
MPLLSLLIGSIVAFSPLLPANPVSFSEGKTGPYTLYGFVPAQDPIQDLALQQWGRPVRYQIVATCATQSEPIFRKNMGIGVMAITETQMEALFENLQFVPVATRPLNAVSEVVSLSIDEVVFAPISNVEQLFFPWSAETFLAISDPMVRALWGHQRMTGALYGEAINYHIKTTLEERWSVAVDPDLVQKADELVACWRSIPLALERINRFDEQRMTGSQTLRFYPHQKLWWKAADEYARTLASQDTPMELRHLLDLNELVVTGSLGGKSPPWRLRDYPVLSLGRQFVGEKDLPEMVGELLCWINTGMERVKQQQENPLVLAALTYQRAVSIHPFRNGNGRTARLLMDVVLMRFGLLPAPLGNNEYVALFGDQPNGRGFEHTSPTEAVQFVLEALRTAYDN